MSNVSGRRAAPLVHDLVVVFFFLFRLVLAQSPATTLVPAIITFGDSTVDVGNNNFLPPAAFKANYPPYGRDFAARTPTGRFCDGKLVTDFTAETLGFTRFPPAYLSPEASGRNLLLGANFASAGSAYYEETAAMYNALSLGKQLEYYKEYRAKLAVAAAGESKAAAEAILAGESKAAAEAILAEAMHLVSTGAGDYVQNYYINSTLRKRYTRHEFSSLLLSSFATFVKGLHGLGARRIGVTSLPPLGCLPAPMSLFGRRQGGRGRNSSTCIAQFNADAEAFNRDLNATANRLSGELPGLTLVVLDIYQPLMELIASPSKHGFTEVRKGCCGTGTSGPSVLCSKVMSSGATVCSDAEKHVFWDGVHPSQAANEFIAGSVMIQGIPLIP